MLTLNQQELQFVYDPARYVHGAPLEELAALRKHHAIIWVDEHELENWPGGDGFWLVLRHAECVQVLKNARIYSSHFGGTQMRNPASKQDLSYVQKMMLNMDPPQHTRLRRMLINVFTSSAIAKLEEKINGHAREIVDRVVGNTRSGECDFVKDIVADMPLLCLADIFGLPQEDRYLMFDWANRVIGFQDPDYADSFEFDLTQGSEMARAALQYRPEPDSNGLMPDPRSKAGMQDLYHYAHLLAEHKRAHPGEDVMSLLLKQVDGECGRLSLEEFENMFWLFCVAGNETLRNGMPGGMIGLLENKELWQELQQNPSAMPAAVEEMLRWWTPVMNFRRTAIKETELAGHTIRAGDKVIVSFLSANHDDTIFSQPHEFNIHRASNPHLSFGYGPHFCLGAHLALAQMAALFNELSARCKSIEAAAPPTFLRSNFQRGVKSLPIRWQLK